VITTTLLSSDADTIIIPHLSVGDVTQSSLSVHGRITTNQLSVHEVVSRLSVGQELVVSSMISASGSIYTEATGAGGGAFIAGVLSVQNAAVMNSTLSVSGEATIGSTLSVVGQAAFTDVVDMYSVCNIAGPLSVNDAVHIVGANGVLSVQGLTTLGGGLSVGTGLYSEELAILKEGLSVGGKVEMLGVCNIAGQSSIEGDVFMGYRLSVANNVRFDKVLDVADESRLRKAVKLDKTLSVAETVYVGGDITTPSSLNVGVGGSGTATIRDLSAGSTTLNSATVETNLIVTGDLTVNGSTTTVNTTQLEITDPIIEIGAGTANGQGAFSGIKIIKDSVNTDVQAGIFREHGANPYFAMYETVTGDGSSGTKAVGDLRISALSAASSAYVNSTLSVQGAVDLHGRTQLQSTLSVGSDAYVGGVLSVQGIATFLSTSLFKGQISVAGTGFIGASLSVGGTADIHGRTRINNTLSVASTAFVGDAMEIAGQLDVTDTARIMNHLSAGDTATIGGRLSVGGFGLVQGTLSVGESVVLKEGLSVSTVATMTPHGGSSTFTFGASKITLVQTLGGTPTYRLVFNQEPVSVTFSQAGRDDITFTKDANGSLTEGWTYSPSFAPAGDYAGKWVWNLRYNGTQSGNGVISPDTMTVTLVRPYVPLDSFTIIDVGAADPNNNKFHDIANSIDAFTAGSGELVPTLSVAGDIIAGSVISVGHGLFSAKGAQFAGAASTVGIQNILSVHGDTNLNSRVTIGGEAGQFLSVGGNTVLQGTLSVEGITTFLSTANIGGALSVAGQITTESGGRIKAGLLNDTTLSVGSTAHIVGITKMESDLSVGGANATMKGHLSVGTPGIHTAGTLVVAGEARITQAILGSDLLSIAGATSLEDIVKIGDGTAANGMLSVAAFAIFDKTLSVGTVLTTSNLSVNAAEMVSLSVNVLTVGGSQVGAGRAKMPGISVGNLGVNIDGTLELGLGLSTVHQIADLGDSYLSINAFTIINHSLSVGDMAVLGSTLSVGSDTYIGGVLSVQGIATFLSTSLFKGQISVAGTGFIGDSLSVGGIADIHGRTRINNTLSVASTAFVGDAMEIDGQLDVTDTVQVLNHLSVGDNATIGDQLSVGGFAVVKQSLSVGGRADILGTLSVQGDAYFDGFMGVDGQLDVTDTARIESHLSVGDNATIGDQLSVGGFGVVKQSLSVGGLVDIMGALSVEGAAYFDGVMGVDGQLDVTDTARIESHLSVGDNATIGDQLSVGGFGVVKQSLSVGGLVDIMGALSVEGAAYFSSECAINSHLSAGGVATLGTDVGMGVGVLSVADTVMLKGGSGYPTFSLIHNGAQPHQAAHTLVGAGTTVTAIRIELEHAHTLQMVDGSEADVALAHNGGVATAENGRFYNEIPSSVFATSGIGGFKVVPTGAASFYNYATTTEILLVILKTSAGSDIILHDPRGLHGAPVTAYLSGGSPPPTLSVGGRVNILENLSVGFDTILGNHLSVAKSITCLDQAVTNIATIATLSTNSFYAVDATFGDSKFTKLSVQSLFMDTAVNAQTLSIGSTTFLKGVTTAEADVIMQSTLSVNGEAHFSHLSVADTYANLLSVQTGISHELSVHTLYVQNVGSTAPGAPFSFNEAARFEGDLTVNGALHVTELLFTGAGGISQVTSYNTLTINGMLSTAQVVLPEESSALTATSPGVKGEISWDSNYLYLCIDNNLWRRVTLSAIA
jgi:UDP-3-O-[3-hydroxymyristoyl] glucosamine N-acyltransferase